MTTLLDSPVSMRRRSAVAAMFFMTAGLALPGTSTIPSGDAKPPALASGTLNIDSLRQMLVNMGFEPEKSGDKNFLLTITRDSYTLRVHVAMSPNDKFVWLETRFGVFPEAAKMTAILDRMPHARHVELIVLVADYREDIRVMHLVVRVAVDCLQREAEIVAAGGLDPRGHRAVRRA